MVNCNSSIKIDKNILIVELISSSLVTFFGIILNIFAMWVFCFKLGRLTETRIYMISLAVADLMLALTLPFKMYFHNNNSPIDLFCRIIFCLYCMNMPMSINTITLIALDRYIAIKHPLKAKVIRSPRNSVIICLFLWLCCFLFTMSHFHLSKEKQELCFYETSVENLPHIPIKFTVFFFIPLVILLFCSIQVIRRLKKKQNTNLQEEKLTHKAIRLVSVNLVIFIICFLPFHLSLLAKYLVDASRCDLISSINKTLHATSIMANQNCCLDAICYYLVAKEFQQAATHLTPFKVMQSKSNLTEDSQL
ncbi:G-protein coupled receptor 35 isoform X2 [Pogona vitticeps]